jgi:hypothetical protein
MRAAVLGLMLAGVGASPALAQPLKPIPRFVIDCRGFLTTLGADVVTATDLGVATTDLPSRAVGGALGADLYLVRTGPFMLGVGAEGLLGRGRRQSKDASGQPTGSVIERRLRGVAGTLSLNFGHRDGWSYVSAGGGPLRFETFTSTQPPTEAPLRETALNFGAGARWFKKGHWAFCFDVRLYYTRNAPATLTAPGRDKKRLLVLSAGIAIR